MVKFNNLNKAVREHIHMLEGLGHTIIKVEDIEEVSVKDIPNGGMLYYGEYTATFSDGIASKCQTNPYKKR